LKKSKNKRLPGKGNKADRNDSTTTPEFEAKLIPFDTSRIRLQITEKRSQNNLQRDVNILCLKCGGIIEEVSEAGDDTSKQTIFRAPVPDMIGHVASKTWMEVMLNKTLDC
jgi:hypothetical protein